METEQENGNFTEEQINSILNLKGADGKQIDIFDLHGVLFIGNCGPVQLIKTGHVVETTGWDLTKTYAKFSEHSLPINIDDFEFCKDEDDVRETFHEKLEEAVTDKLV